MTEPPAERDTDQAAKEAPHDPAERAELEDRAEAVARPARGSRARRFAPLLLLAGALVSGALVAPKIPHEREVELRFSDRATIAQVDLEWTEPSEPDQALQANSWRFAQGAAPASLVSKVRLPNGRYDLDVLVHRSDRPDAVERRSLVLGESARVTVRLP